jgi:hypothetical protein
VWYQTDRQTGIMTQDFSQAGLQKCQLPTAVVLGCLLLLTACRTAEPFTTLAPAATPPPPPVVAEPVVVHHTAAVTNSLQHVTYTFVLPRPPTHGYIIEESIDGEEWIVYGRSSSSNLRQVTMVDATPQSGKQWRVILP